MATGGGRPPCTVGVGVTSSTRKMLTPTITTTASDTNTTVR